MKRKGRKSTKKEAEKENGESLNGDSTDNGEPEEKKVRASKSNRNSSISVKERLKDESKSKDDTRSKSKKGSDDEDEGDYEVESVLDEKKIKGVTHFLIRWKGYEPESDTWEPEATLDCPELIADFKKKRGKSKSSKSSSKLKSRKDSKKSEWDENENFEVDRILEVYHKKTGKREFLVSWKGYPNTENSWEPEENMDCKDLIVRFMSKVEKAKEADARELRANRTHTDRFTLTMKSGGRRLSKRHQGKQRVQYHDAE